MLKFLQHLGNNTRAPCLQCQNHPSFDSAAARVNPMEVCQPCGLRANPATERSALGPRTLLLAMKICQYLKHSATDIQSKFQLHLSFGVPTAEVALWKCANPVECATHGSAPTPRNHRCYIAYNLKVTRGIQGHATECAACALAPLPSARAHADDLERARARVRGLVEGVACTSLQPTGSQQNST